MAYRTAPLWGYLVGRLASALAILAVVVVLSFVLLRLVPGGPFEQARRLAPAVKANLEAHYGLDRPISVQLGFYLKDLAQGDLGVSMSQPDRPVAELLGAALPVSLRLGLLALGLCVPLGLGLGLAAACWPGSHYARLLQWLTAIALSVPGFVLAPLLMLGLGVYLRWLPLAPWGDAGISQWVLPAITLAWLPTFELVRLSRASLVQAQEESFVLAARRRGLSEALLMRAYIVPAALPALLAYLAPLAASVLSGSLVVERVFGVPGMGSYLVEGALARDYPLVLGATLVYLSVLLGLSLCADLLIMMVSPQRRLSLMGKT